jgi:O-antigen ligase
MIVAVAITILISYSYYLNRKKIVVLLIVAPFIVLPFYDIFNTAILSKLYQELSTINERTVTWIMGYAIIVKNFWTGVGIGQSPLVYSAYMPDMIVSGFESLLFYEIFRQPPMNTYIEWTAETGIIGIAIIFYIAYRLYKYKPDNRSQFGNFIRLGYGSSIFAIAVAANSSSGNFYTGVFVLMISMYIVGIRLLDDPAIGC